MSAVLTASQLAVLETLAAMGYDRARGAAAISSVGSSLNRLLSHLEEAADSGGESDGVPAPPPPRARTMPPAPAPKRRDHRRPDARARPRCDLTVGAGVAVSDGGARGVVARSWQRDNGHWWLDLKTTAGDVIAVRSTVVEAATLTEEEAAGCARVLDPTAALQARVDGIITLPAKGGGVIANVFRGADGGERRQLVATGPRGVACVVCANGPTFKLGGGGVYDGAAMLRLAVRTHV